MRHPRQRGRGIVRRKQLPACSKTRAFFQVQVSDNQQAVFVPVKRAPRIGEQRHAGKNN
jgi:hypothetical protein